MIGSMCGRLGQGQAVVPMYPSTEACRLHRQREVAEQVIVPHSLPSRWGGRCVRFRPARAWAIEPMYRCATDCGTATCSHCPRRRQVAEPVGTDLAQAGLARLTASLVDDGNRRVGVDVVTDHLVARRGELCDGDRLGNSLASSLSVQGAPLTAGLVDADVDQAYRCGPATGIMEDLKASVGVDVLADRREPGAPDLGQGQLRGNPSAGRRLLPAAALVR
jgi:hypothetical protein